MGKFYTLILLLLTGSFAYSQKEANNWFFGQQAGVTFNAGAPVAVTTGQLSTIEGCSSISDANGNLLFYTDGIKVWNKNHAIMPNGSNLMGNPISSQSGIIVPKPGSSTIYYVFTVDKQGGYGGGTYSGFRYSEVDMSLLGGLGDIVLARKNVLVKDTTTESLAAVKHGNGTDYWVVVHGIHDNRYYSYLVTSAGVNTIPVISFAGPNVIVGPSFPFRFGQGANGIIKISPDGRKIAATHFGLTDIVTGAVSNKDLVISDFNNNTGSITNAITIPIHFSGKSEAPYGIEFSNCTEYLYLTEVFIDTLGAKAWPFETRIWRFDMNAGSIPASKTLFQLIPNEYDGALQLAPDGKIYCAVMIKLPDSTFGYGSALHAINNPRLPSATFTANAVNLSTRFSALGLPPFIATYFYNSTFTFANAATGDTILCSGDSVRFKAVASAYDSIRWHFGDIASGINNTTTLVNPTHLFSSNGTFTVRFYKYLCGIRDSVVKVITINQYPVVTNISDTTICSGSVVLNATAVPVTSYLWSTTATTPTITVSTPGPYKVTVSNNGCIRRDSMILTVSSPTPVSVSIASDVNNVCDGTNVTFTATPSTTGLSPSYQWLLNGSPVGTNSNTYSNASLNNNDSVRVVMTSTATCITGSPATSNKIVMIIKSNPTVTVNSPSICNGQATNLSASGATSYTWTSGLSAIQNPSTGPLTTTTTYTVTGTTSGCTGTAVSTVTVKPNPTVTVNSPNICNGQTTNLNASGATSYTWTSGLTSIQNPSTGPLTTTTTYTVTGTTSGCTNTAVSTVTVTPLPNVTVNSPGICNGQSANLSASGAASYTWTGGLTSTSNPSTGPLTTTTTYTVTGTASGCTNTAISTVTVTPLPTVTVNSPGICNGQSASLSASGATSYTWANGLASISNPTTPNLTTTTTYTVTGTTSGCTNTAVSTVTVTPLPNVTVNSPNICNGQTAALSASGATSYTWTSGLAATANPTTPSLTTTTTYTVTGTTSGCTNTAVATVSVNPNLVIGVNAPNICNGQTAQLNASGATSYTWTGGLAPTSNPTTGALTTTTTYTVTGTTGVCTGTAVATVSVNPNLVIGVNSPTICNGQTAALTASGATSYTWTNGLASISNPITPALTTTTTYTVTGTTGACTGTAVSTVTVNPNPNVTVNNPNICSGQTAALSASGATSYTWTNGLAAISNPTTPALTTTTTYTVTGTTGTCTNTAVSTVTINPGLIVNVNSPNICSGQTTQLNASGATSYTWTGGLAATANPTTPALTTTTTYTVTGTTSGCTGTAVATVSVNSSGLVVSVNNLNICFGQTAQLSASGATSYTWTNGLASTSNPTTPALTTTTTYTVTGTTSGCTGTAVSTVTVNPGLIVNVNSPNICSGQTTQLNASGATSYTWTGGLAATANPTTPALTTTTTYTVTGTTSGCTGTAVATVSVNSSGLVVSVNNPNICSGQTAQLSVSGATSYTWTSGLASTSNPTTPALTTTTTYTVTGTTSGCTGTAVSTVTVNPDLVVDVNSPTICEGRTTQLTASGATSYTWTGGLAATSNPTTPALTTTTTYTVTGTTGSCTGTATSTVSITPKKITNISSEICQGESITIGAQTFSTNGNHNVTLQSAEGCDSVVILALTVYPLPVINAITDIVLAEFDQQVQLNVTTSSTILSYNWTPANLVNTDSIKNPTAIIKSSTVFTVAVKDNHNCSNTDSVSVKMIDDCSEDFIYMPSAFSPNRDGINDCFGIMSPPKLTNFRMTIFDRWGEKVFETTDEKECWDGTYKGVEAQSDSYSYIVSFKCYNGVDLYKKGAVTILK